MLRGNKHPRNTTTPVGGGISGKLKSPYFYTLASIVILTILSILILNLRLSLTNATGSEGSNDTGIATLSRVDITQAGTGQSVTIDGTTLDEEGENNEVDNAKRRTILNNNVVRYQADLQVSTPGSLTLSITLPANNTIDEATIGSAQGCIAGSKLEAVTVDGKKSYTNNKATCVMNTTSIGQVSWGITAYLWGGNNTKIQPTISLSGIAQSQKPDPITVVGKAKLDIYAGTGNDLGSQNGWNNVVAMEIGVNVPIDSNTGLLGVDPVRDVELNLDMSNIPDGWQVSSCSRGIGGNNFSIVESSKDNLSNNLSCKKQSDDILTLTMNNLDTARLSYGESSSTDSKDRAYYLIRVVNIKVPVSALSSTVKTYSASIDNPTFTTISGQTGTIGIVFHNSWKWSLSSNSWGQTYSWFNWFPGFRGRAY